MSRCVTILLLAPLQMNSLAWSSMKAGGVALDYPFDHRRGFGIGYREKGNHGGLLGVSHWTPSLGAGTEVGPKHLGIREIVLGDRRKTF